MKSLKLVYDNTDGERKDITLPMEKWISDWWFDCDIVPSNNTTILAAELDGEPILDAIPSTDERYKTFEEIAWYFNWDGLNDDFCGAVEENPSMKNDKETFEAWLKANVVT